MNAISMNVIPILSSFASNSNKLESKLTLHNENTGNSAFNVTLKSNDIPCNAGNYMYQSILTPLNKKIGYNYKNIDADNFYLEKRGENYYRIYLNGCEAKENDVYTFSGEYVNPTGIKIDILTSQFKYDGSKFVTYEPEIMISNNENIEAVGNTIYVNNGTSKDELVASIINGFEGTISYAYPAGSIENNKFISRNGSSSFDDFSIYFESNGYSFRYDYKLVVGYKNFVMEKGAAISLNSDLSSIEFRCNIPSSVLEGAEEIGFIAIKNDELNNNDLNEHSLFVDGLFSFNKKEEKKIEAQKRYAFARYNFDGSYTLLGRLDGLEAKDYLVSYRGLFYIKNEYGYFLSNDFDGNQNNSIRSVLGVASRAIDEKDDKKEEIIAKYLSDEKQVAYKVRYINKDNGVLLKEETHVGKLNDNVTISFDETNIGGVLYKPFGPKELSKKLFDNDVVFNFYLVNQDESMNIYAYDCPYLDCRNNYDNDHNKQICSDLVKFGFNGVFYSGQTIGTNDNVDALKDIVRMFHKNGLKTVINDRSYSSNDLHFYDGVPDFSNVPGFAGFLSWDEPLNDSNFDSIKGLSASFNSIYANKSDSKFITTLLPSYSGTSLKDSLNKYGNLITDTLPDYNLRSLCTDFYPFTYKNNSTSLSDYYIHDLLCLRSKSSELNATPFLIMQLSSVADFPRASYYSEMLLQAYMALSFGYKNIVWYKAFSDDETSLFINEKAVDEAFNQKYKVTTSTSLDVLHINKQILNMANLLKGYDYRGTYLSNKLGNYSLHSNSSSMTDLLSSIPGGLKISSLSKYHVGVYKNKDGKYAYVISSYINNDGSYSVKVTSSIELTAYQGENIKTIPSSSSYSFSSLKQGESIVLV